MLRSKDSVSVLKKHICGVEQSPHVCQMTNYQGSPANSFSLDQIIDRSIPPRLKHKPNFAEL